MQPSPGARCGHTIRPWFPAGGAIQIASSHLFINGNMRRQHDCELAFDALRFYADKTGERVTTAKAQRAL